jgi:hypothetical protein
MTKSLNNALSAANYLATSEVLTVATKNALDPAKVVRHQCQLGDEPCDHETYPQFCAKGGF